MPQDEGIGDKPGSRFWSLDSEDAVAERRRTIETPCCRETPAKPVFSKRARTPAPPPLPRRDATTAKPAWSAPRPADDPGAAATSASKAHFRRAALALSALDSGRRIEIFRYLADRSPALVLPATIARELGLTVRTTEAELSRLLQAGLVHAHGQGKHRAFNADRARAGECLDLIHALARALGTI